MPEHPTAGESTRTVELRPVDHHTLFGAQLAETRQSMAIAADLLHDLQERADRAAGAASVDAQSALRILREDLDALDALGWP